MAAACAFCRARIRASTSSPTSRARSSAVGDLGGPGQELLLDPALQAGHRSDQGCRLACLSRQSAAARRREGRGPGVPGVATRSPISGSRTAAYKEVASNLDGEYQGQDLLHRRPARQPGARGAAGGARADAGACSMRAMFTVAESGQGRGVVPALRAQDREPRRICRRWSATTPIITIPPATCSSRSSRPMPTI